MKCKYFAIGMFMMVAAPFALHAKVTKVRLDMSLTSQPDFRRALIALAGHKISPLDGTKLARFEALIHQYGWPTVVAAGRDGVDAAGDLLLRSQAAYDFQNECLAQVFHQLYIDIDARAALTLIDHIEKAQGHPQQGGMLFSLANGKVKLSPPTDPISTINAFRDNYGLPTVEHDILRLQAAVGHGASLTSVAAPPRLSTAMHAVRFPALRAELDAMAKKDQATRNAYIQSGMKANSPEEKVLTDTDTANLAGLHVIFKQHGFPDRPMVGRDGVNNVWLLVQHATADKPLMAKAMQLSRPLMLKGELPRGNYALLVDRVRLQQGEKQLYGSQFKGKPGHFELLPLEDPEHVDQRRAEMGMQPIADYIRDANALYTPKPAASSNPASTSTTSR